MRVKNPRIGVSIAAFNSRERVRECVAALQSSDYPDLYIVVVDDGSTDGTSEMLHGEYPSIVSIRGDGNLWWTGGTNLAIDACLDAECDSILLLNPDSIVDHDAISTLVRVSKVQPDAILASIVVDHDNPETIWWAGSKWGSIKPWLPIWTSRYLFRSGTDVSEVPPQPYSTSEAHGRGVLVPRGIFDVIGLYDQNNFPHYGADVEFSFRAQQAGFPIVVVPEARVRLVTDNTGMAPATSVSQAFQGYWHYLTRRKNGEALIVWWRLLRRYVRWYAVITSYLFIIGLNTYRYWSRAMIPASSQRNPP